MRKKSDEYCINIATLLTIIDDNIRFNELHRLLNKYGAKMSKPTLIEHLNHLLKEKTILRREGKKQSVSYRLNWKKLKQLKKAKIINQIILHDIKNKKIFQSKSLSQQTIHITAMLTIAELFRMKLMILNILEPQNKLDNILSYQVIRDIYTCYTDWLLDSCKESKEISLKVLHYIDKSIKNLEGAFLERNPDAPELKQIDEANLLTEF